MSLTFQQTMFPKHRLLLVQNSPTMKISIYSTVMYKKLFRNIIHVFSFVSLCMYVFVCMQVCVCMVVDWSCVCVCVSKWGLTRGQVEVYQRTEKRRESAIGSRERQTLEERCQSVRDGIQTARQLEGTCQSEDTRSWLWDRDRDVLRKMQRQKSWGEKQEIDKHVDRLRRFF